MNLTTADINTIITGMVIATILITPPYVLILIRTAAEMVRAYRETRARQKVWHPDPKADRRRIAALRAARARQDQRTVNKCIDSDRRQAMQEAADRAEKAAGARI